MLPVARALPVSPRARLREVPPLDVRPPASTLPPPPLPRHPLPPPPRPPWSRPHLAPRDPTESASSGTFSTLWYLLIIPFVLLFVLLVALVLVVMRRRRMASRRRSTLRNVALVQEEERRRAEKEAQRRAAAEAAAAAGWPGPAGVALKRAGSTASSYVSKLGRMTSTRSTKSARLAQGRFQGRGRSRSLGDVGDARRRQRLAEAAGAQDVSEKRSGHARFDFVGAAGRGAAHEENLVAAAPASATDGRPRPHDSGSRSGSGESSSGAAAVGDASRRGHGAKGSTSTAATTVSTGAMTEEEKSAGLGDDGKVWIIAAAGPQERASPLTTEGAVQAPAVASEAQVDNVARSAASPTPTSIQEKRAMRKELSVIGESGTSPDLEQLERASEAQGASAGAPGQGEASDVKASRRGGAALSPNAAEPVHAAATASTGTSLARRISERLRKGSPSRPRKSVGATPTRDEARASASPAKPSPSPRTKDSTSTSPAAAGLSRARSAPGYKYAGRRRALSAGRPSKTSASDQPRLPSPAAVSWAYTSKAAEWRSASASPAAANAARPADREGPATGSAEVVDAGAVGADGSTPLSRSRSLDPATTSHGATSTEVPDAARGWNSPALRPPPFVRRTSIGVAGSHFKETFEDEE